MIFIVTDKLKHKTRIEGVGKKVQSGDILFLTETDVSKTTISKWLSNDLIEYIGDIDFPPTITVKNKTTKSLNLGNYILKNSQKKTLSEQMFDRNIVLKLILKDYIVVDGIEKEDIDELKNQIEEEEEIEEVTKIEENEEEEQDEGIKAWEAGEQKLKTQKPIDDQDNIINVSEEEEDNKNKVEEKENKTKKQEEPIELDSKGNPVSDTLSEIVHGINNSEDDVDIINDEEGVEGVELDF